MVVVAICRYRGEDKPILGGENGQAAVELVEG
jgi:hypothetical protein